MIKDVKILEYRGGEHHITIFFQDDKEKYYVCYARTGKFQLNVENEYREYMEDMKSLFKTVVNRDMHINIPIISHGDIMLNLIHIKDREQFELVDEVLKTIWED